MGNSAKDEINIQTVNYWEKGRDCVPSVNIFAIQTGKSI